MLIVTVFLFWESVFLANGFVPHQCVKNFSKPEWKICCPTPLGFYQPCGYPYRGECQLLESVDYSMFIPIQPYQDDIRFQWPLKMFNFFCHCYGNFAGIDCGHCSFGYRGEDCSKKKTVLRRNVLSLNETELTIFRAVLNFSKFEMSSFMVLQETNSPISDIPQFIPITIYEMFVFIHQFSARPSLNDENLCEHKNILSGYTDHNHNGPGFLTWHRYFMMEWERTSAAIAKNIFQVEDFTFPYWDWTDRNHCDVCTDTILGSPGEAYGNSRRLNWKSIFYNWAEVCSNGPFSLCTPCTFGNSISSPISRKWLDENFPTKQEVYKTLELTDYYQAIYKGYQVVLDNTVTLAFRHYKPCDSFASALEGSCKVRQEFTMHNKIHNIIMGTFRGSKTSVNDPLFVLHHIQVDRIFELWLRKHRYQLSYTFPRRVIQHGHCYRCFIVGFMPPIRHKDVFKLSFDLGYDYDSFSFG